MIFMRELTKSAKPVGVWATFQPWILAGERFGLLRRMATESVSSYEQMKSANCVRETPKGNTRVRGELDFVDPRRNVRADEKLTAFVELERAKPDKVKTYMIIRGRLTRQIRYRASIIVPRQVV
jgi:hypothetical protein